jgi:hypothetical protein
MSEPRSAPSDEQQVLINNGSVNPDDCGRDGGGVVCDGVEDGIASSLEGFES